MLANLIIVALVLLILAAIKHKQEKFAEPGSYTYAQSPMQQFSIATQAIQDGFCDKFYQAFIADPTNTEKETALMQCKGQQNLLVGKIAGLFSGGSGRTG